MRDAASEAALALPLLAFCTGLDAMLTPGEVVERLHDAVQQIEQLRDYHVMSAFYLSRVITDHAQIDGKTLFWHRSVPLPFRTMYFDTLAANGPSFTQQLARERSQPFTFTEATRLVRPTGRQSWTVELMRKYGMRDGLYCPFPRWAVVYWTRRPVVPSAFALGCLCGAAYLAHLRIDELVPRPERLERRGKELTQRELEVLRMAADGLTREQIADALDISDRTVEHLIETAREGLQAKNITEAVAVALRYKFFA